jgi:hypothetical protein
MECEKEIVSKLEQLGYHIFYRNMYIYYNKCQVSELDIIGANFIVEVKSTKFENCETEGFKFFYRHNLLPKNYTYFVYSALSTDEAIKSLNETYAKSSYIFLNNIENIKEYIRPLKNIECTTTMALSNILRIHDNDLEKINKIYVPYDIYNKVHITLIYLLENKLYNFMDSRVKLDKLVMLVKTNKLVFTKDGLEYLYPLKKTHTPRRKLYLSKLIPIEFKPYYYIQSFRKCPKYDYSS